MAIEVRAKALKKNYGSMIIGLPYSYHNLIKDLMNKKDPEFTTCGKYGWNCDVYLVKGYGYEDYPPYLISVGYRPFGKYTDKQKFILEGYRKQFITRDECFTQLNESLKDM